MITNLGRDLHSNDFNKNNDQVWNALQPSLKLASRVIRSNHPHWRMLLAGIYHMRKVPREKDGRTIAEKREPGYREYRSWLNIDRNKMFPSARRLYDLRFEAARATLGILPSEGSMNIRTLPTLNWTLEANMIIIY